MAVGKHIWMEGISGWEQKEGHREGGAFTGGLLQALPFTWRRPRWHYCQLNRLINNESQNLQLIEKRVLDPPKKCSNAQTSEVTRELFIPFNICLIRWKPMCHIQSKDNTRLVPTFIQQSSCNAQCQRSNRMYMRCKTPSIGSADGKITRTGSICGVQIKNKKGLLNFNGNFRAWSRIWDAFPTQRKLDLIFTSPVGMWGDINHQCIHEFKSVQCTRFSVKS